MKIKLVESKYFNKTKQQLKEQFNKQLKEGYYGQTLADFLDDCLNAEDVDIMLYGSGDNPIFGADKHLNACGRYEDIPQNLLDCEFADFDTYPRRNNHIYSFCINVSKNTDNNYSSSGYETIEDFLGDYNGDQISIFDTDDDVQDIIYEGYVDEIPEEILENYVFESFDAADQLVINLSLSNFEDDSDYDDYEDDEEEE